MLYIELQLNSYTKWTTCNYMQIYSITVVTKPAKLSEVDTKVNTYFIAIAKYMYSHIMCSIRTLTISQHRERQAVYVQIYFINT